MNEEQKKDSPTLAPPEGQSEDVYSASTVVGKPPPEILKLIAEAEAKEAKGADSLLSSGPPKVMIETPAAIPITDFSMPDMPKNDPLPTEQVAGVASGLSDLSSGLLDDDDWLIPDEAAKPPPAPPHRAPEVARPKTPPIGFAPAAPPAPVLPPVLPPVPPPAPVAEPALMAVPVPVFAPPAQVPEPVGSLAAVPEPLPSDPRPSERSPLSRPRTPRVDFAPASVRGPASTSVGAVLGLIDPPPAIPEERASAAKLIAAAPDPNERVSRVDDDILSMRAPPAAPDFTAEIGAPPSSGTPGGAGVDAFPVSVKPPSAPPPQLGALGDPMPVLAAEHNPMHVPIGEPNSMHVPIGEARALPSRTPVGAIVAVVAVVLLLALGGIVFAVLR
jgi:hypothetical protein